MTAAVDVSSPSGSRSTHSIPEIVTPLLPVTQVITHLGTNPMLTMPVVVGVEPDVRGAWHRLAEVAGFFGIAMPGSDDFRVAVLEQLAITRPVGTMLAVTVTVFDVDGRSRVVVGSEPVEPVRPVPVRIGRCDAVGLVPRSADPVWRRMAGRTTSKGHLDQFQRWLADQGWVDAVPSAEPSDAPYLGALVVETPAGLFGIEDPEPASLLDQLAACGVTAHVERTARVPADVTRAWWVSPRFLIHPVADLDGTSLPAHGAPPFVEQR